MKKPNKTKQKKRIIIVGGGLSGLAAADHLADDFDVTILEKESYLGGLASSFEKDGKLIPKYYHQVFKHDYTTQEYLKKHGMLDKMSWKRIKMGICAKGKIHNFTEPVGLLKFDYLSLAARIRYGLFGLYVFTVMNPAKIKDETDAKEWLTKYAGKEVTEKLFYQLYAKNKFNIPLERISAKQFAYRLKAKEAMGVFGYPTQGLQLLIDRMEKDLIKRGCKITKNSKITKIHLKNKKITQNDSSIDYDSIIITIPTPTFISLTEGLPAKYKEKISKIRYCPAICVTFATKDFLSKHYWLNLLEERTHTLFQHSRLYDGYPYKINWILRYGGSEEDYNLTDKEIEKTYLTDVKKYFPKTKILWTKISKDTHAEPIYDKDFAKHRPDYKTPVDGLYFANTATSYPKIRNMNTALQTGQECAKIVKKDSQ